MKRKLVFKNHKSSDNFYKNYVFYLIPTLEITRRDNLYNNYYFISLKFLFYSLTYQTEQDRDFVKTFRNFKSIDLRNGRK